MSLNFPISLAGKRGGFPEPLHWWDLDDDEVWSDDGSNSWDPMSERKYNNHGLSVLASGGPNGQDVSNGYGRSKGVVKYNQVWDGSSNSISHFCWIRRTADPGAGQWFTSWHGAGSGGVVPTTGDNMMWTLNASGATFGQLRHAIWDTDGNRSYYAKSNAITNNVWYHLGFTFDAETKEHNLYMNGVLIGTKIASHIGDLNTTDLAHFAIGLIASSMTSTGAFHQGQIAMVGTWDTVLTDEQIKTLVNNGAGRKYGEFEGASYEPTINDTVLYRDGNPMILMRNNTSIPRFAYNVFEEIQIGAQCTNIASQAFRNLSKVTGDIFVPSSVLTIGSYAFENCTNINGQLTLHEGLQSIGVNAFRGNKFVGDIVIPNSITDIPASMLQSAGSGGNKLVLGNAITNIGDQAFEYSKIARIDLHTPVAPTYTYKTFRNMSLSDGNLHVPSNAIGYDNVVPTYRTIVYDLPAQTYRKSNNDFTSNTSGIQTLSRSSALSSTFEIWNAYNPTKNWLTTSLPSWQKIDFGQAENISKIIYNVRNDSAGVQSPQSYIIESSDDDVNWTTRSTVTDGPREQNSDVVHELDTPATARYWRMTVSSSYGENRIGLDKMEWHGY